MQQQTMLPFASPALELKRRSASSVIPAWLIGLLAGLQVILWLAIIILEGFSVYYDAREGTIYAGFWCSIIFLTTWISMFCFLCCGKANCCGIYLVVINTIALCFSIILVTFAAIFVHEPCKCIGLFCYDSSWYRCMNIVIRRKVPYLKGLLACSVLMLLTNLTYLITYITISIWLFIRGNADMKKMNATFQQQSGHVNFEHQQQYPPQPMNYPQQNSHQSYPINYFPPNAQQPYPTHPMNYPPQNTQQQYQPYSINNAYYQAPTPTKPISPQQPSLDDTKDEERL